MRREDLIQSLRGTPFQPFRLHVSDGAAFEIRHPEMLMVTRHSAIVGILEPERLEPGQNDNGNSGSKYPNLARSATVDLLHVTRIEPLAAGH